VLEVASVFGGSVQMLPERQGNRMASSLDASAIRSLGWRPRPSLVSYIAQTAGWGMKQRPKLDLRRA
jgi:UDP-glucose 4-epimerase